MPIPIITNYIYLKRKTARKKTLNTSVVQPSSLLCSFSARYFPLVIYIPFELLQRREMGSTQFISLRNCGHGRFYEIALGVAYFNLVELRRPRGRPAEHLSHAGKKRTPQWIFSWLSWLPFLSFYDSCKSHLSFHVICENAVSCCILIRIPAMKILI